MSIFVRLLLLVTSLTGCALPQATEYENFQTTGISDVEAGRLRWSDYYIQLYDHAKAAGQPGTVLVGIAQKARVSMEFDAGAISNTEYQYRIREIDATLTAQLDAARRANALEISSRMQRYQLPLPSENAKPLQLQQIRQIPNLHHQETKGAVRYCSYSDGTVLTIPARENCIIQLN